MSNITRSAGDAYAITPDDDNDLDVGPTRGIYVGGAGDVAVKFPGNATAVTFAGVAAGSVLPIAPARVMETSTTATSLVALL